MKASICTPVHSDPSFHYTASLAGLLIHTARERPDIELGCTFQRGTGIDRNRRLLAEAALGSGAEWLLWVDADQSFPPDTLLRLLAHNRPVVGCNIARRADGQPVTARALNGGTVDSTKSGSEKVDTTGFGVMLTSGEVFAKVRKPWFVWSEMMGEDERFCRAARQAGFNIWVDHDLSRQIGHIGEKIYTL